jgi:YesN/AraC family two-component response regulator
MHGIIEEQNVFVKKAFIDRLLKGEFNSIQEINTILQYTDMEIKGNYFAILILKLDGYNNMLTPDILKILEIKKLIIKESISKNSKDIDCFLDIAEDKIALLIHFDFENERECKTNIKNIIANIKEDLLNEYGIKVLIGVGNVYERIMDISRSFSEANQALDYISNWTTCKVKWFDDLPKQSNGYYYPIDIEIRIINNAKAGNINEIATLLNEIFMENFKVKSLSIRMIHNLIYEMKGTLIKFIDYVAFDDNKFYSNIRTRVNSIDGQENIDEIHIAILDIYGLICDKINNHKKSHNIVLKEKIMDYINSAYVNVDFCLGSISKEFDLTEVYISQFFKEQIGVNFSTYLERLRMETACKLLTSTKLSVKEIALRTGFSNANTFTRAFKRFEGITPSGYRNITQ